MNIAGRNTEIENIQCNVFFAEQVLDEMDCKLANKEVTSDNGGPLTIDDSTKNSYVIPLIMMLLILVIPSVRHFTSNKSDEQNK